MGEFNIENLAALWMASLTFQSGLVTGVPELMLLYNDLPPHSSTPPLPVAQSDSMIFYVNITTYMGLLSFNPVFMIINMIKNAVSHYVLNCHWSKKNKMSILLVHKGWIRWGICAWTGLMENFRRAIYPTRSCVQNKSLQLHIFFWG